MITYVSKLLGSTRSAWGGGQGLAPVDERVVRSEEIDDVAAFLVGHGVSLGGCSRSGARVDYIAQAKGPGL